MKKPTHMDPNANARRPGESAAGSAVGAGRAATAAAALTERRPPQRE